MNSGALELALVGLAGGGIGFVSGMFGIGGGFLIVPVLNIGLKVPIELAVGAGACQGLGPATTALLARRVSTADVRMPLTIAGGLFVGVLCGAALLERAQDYGELSVPGAANSVSAAEFTVLAVYLAILSSLGAFTLWEARRPHKPEFLKASVNLVCGIPPFADFREFERPQMSIPVLAWFGLVVGFLSGLIGINGGLILLPGMIYLFGIRTHRAVLSSLVIVWLVALESTIAHAWHDNVRLDLVAVLLVGGTVGARFGAEFAGRLEGRKLRNRFAWLLLATSALIAGRLGRLLFG